LACSYSGRDLQKGLVSGQRRQVELLPRSTCFIAKALADERRAVLRSADLGYELRCAAQAGQTPYQQRAVGLQLWIERYQSRPLTSCLWHLDAEKSGKINDTVHSTAQIGYTKEPGLRVRYRRDRGHREYLSCIGQWKQKAVPATLDRQPGQTRRLRKSRLHTVSQAAL